jgi:putative sterol carrier protein
MSVKYLSKEWADEFNAKAAENKAPYKGRKATILNVVTDAPDGEVRYVIQFGDDSVSIIMGDQPDAEVTMKESYDTSVGINKGEIDGQKAFMQGKVKISGKMVKMMQLRGPLGEVSKVLSAIPTDY